MAKLKTENYKGNKIMFKKSVLGVISSLVNSTLFNGIGNTKEESFNDIKRQIDNSSLDNSYILLNKKKVEQEYKDLLLESGYETSNWRWFAKKTDNKDYPYKLFTERFNDGRLVEFGDDLTNINYLKQ